MLKRLLLLVAALIVGLGWIAAALLWFSSRVIAPSPAQVGPPPPDLEAEAVEFSGGEATRLAGWWLPGKPGHGVVVLLHPAGTNRLAMLSRARALHALGVASLLFDQRAHGESGGERITFGHLEAQDARAAVDFARQHAPGERIGALGIGLGGAALLLGPERGALDALVVESTPPTLHAALRRRLKSQIGPLADRVLPLVAYQVVPELGELPERLASLQGAARLGRPLLVVAGDNDPNAPGRETQALFDAASEPKALWIVPGAGSGDLVERDPAEYQRRVLTFLAGTLRAPLAVNTRMIVTPELALDAVPDPPAEDEGQGHHLD